MYLRRISSLTYNSTIRDGILRGYEPHLAVALFCHQYHTVAFDAAYGARLEIGKDTYLPAYHFFRRIIFGNTGYDDAFVHSGVNREFEKFVRFGHTFGIQDGCGAYVHLLEVLERALLLLGSHLLCGLCLGCGLALGADGIQAGKLPVDLCILDLGEEELCGLEFVALGDDVLLSELVPCGSDVKHPAEALGSEGSEGLECYREVSAYLERYVEDGVLNVPANGEICYKLKGVNIKLAALWAFEPPVGGGDTHYSLMRGSKASIVVKQGQEQNFVPELYVSPVSNDEDYAKALEASFAKLVEKYPGIALEPCDEGWHVSIPASYRNGHEAHFGQVTENYLNYLSSGNMPEWEVPNMITKYYITTQGWQMAQ